MHVFGSFHCYCWFELLGLRRSLFDVEIMRSIDPIGAERCTVADGHEVMLANVAVEREASKLRRMFSVGYDMRGEIPGGPMILSSLPFISARHGEDEAKIILLAYAKEIMMRNRKRGVCMQEICPVK